MSKSRFDIVNATLRSGIYLTKEWRYLLAAGIFPVIVSLATSSFLFFNSKEMSFLIEFMISTPAILSLGWYIFIITRHIVFVERADKIADDAVARKDRHELMQLSMIAWLLINMATIAFANYVVYTQGLSKTETTPEAVFALILMGAFFWGIRLAVAPILIAIGYPVRKFIYQVNGIAISFRLIGLFFLFYLPVVTLQMGLFMALHDGVSLKLSASGAFTLTLGSDILRVVLTATFTPAVVYALHDILGKKSPHGVRA